MWRWRLAGYPGLWLIVAGAATLAASLLVGFKVSAIIAGSLLLCWLWWRLMRNPRLNNWALGFFWILFLGLLINAAIQGGGPPTIESPVVAKAEQMEERSIAENYWPSAWGSSPQAKLRLEQQATAEVAASVKPQGTWLWWWLCLASFLLALASVPIAFWDEIRNAYWWAVDRHQLRAQRIAIGGGSPPIGGPATASASKSNFWRLLQVFIPLELSSEIIGGFIERLLRHR